jgi:multisubunit Na+/H+ antiporter MnhF subunit
VNGWLWAATVLTAALVPLLAVATRRTAIEGVVALEVAGSLTATCLLLLAEGTDRESFADLAIVLGVLSFVGAIAFLRFIEAASSS